MKDKEIKIYFTLDNYTLIGYNKSDWYEYCVALNYNESEKEWASGTYFTTLEAAIACMLLKANSRYVKSPYQLECEEASEMTYERLMELATLFKDGLIEDDKESAMEYFEDTCEMDEREMKFFGIGDDDEI